MLDFTTYILGFIVTTSYYYVHHKPWVVRSKPFSTKLDVRSKTGSLLIKNDNVKTANCSKRPPPSLIEPVNGAKKHQTDLPLLGFCIDWLLASKYAVPFTYIKN